MLTNPASMPQFGSEAKRLKEELPDEIRAALERYEAIGDFHHPDYEAAVLEFYRRHLCRLPEFPECLVRTAINLHDNAVYETIHFGIEGSRLEIFENSSHTPHLKEEEAYLAVLSEFMKDVDRSHSIT